MSVTKEQLLAHADRLSQLRSDLLNAKESITKEAGVDFNRVILPADMANYSHRDIGIGTVSDVPSKGTAVSADDIFRQFVLS